MFEIDYEGLCEKDKRLVDAYGRISVSRCETERAAYSLLKACHKKASIVNIACEFLEAAELYISLEVKKIARHQGAKPGDVARFIDKFSDTVATLEIKEVCDE